MLSLTRRAVPPLRVPAGRLRLQVHPLSQTRRDSLALEPVAISMTELHVKGGASARVFVGDGVEVRLEFGTWPLVVSGEVTRVALLDRGRGFQAVVRLDPLEERDRDRLRWFIGTL